jgi:zinc transporter 9
MGVLVGTSLIVIIPEGIEAVYTAGPAESSHGKRSLQRASGIEVRWLGSAMNTIVQVTKRDNAEKLGLADPFNSLPGPVIPAGFEANRFDAKIKAMATTATASSAKETGHPSEEVGAETPLSNENGDGEEHRNDPPTFWVGFSLILGFILMFLIDKLPRLAAENLQAPPTTRHISLDNLSQGLHISSASTDDEESESFLQSLTPSPKQTRSLATTTGLVIHAAADGIAMGASASSSNTKLGFIIFIAIMIHKAPAAFGLTSVLLKQGLSKRAARGHLIIFSLAAPLGAITTWFLVNILGGGAYTEGEKGQWWTGMLLLFSAGTFL